MKKLISAYHVDSTVKGPEILSIMNMVMLDRTRHINAYIVPIKKKSSHIILKALVRNQQKVTVTFRNFQFKIHNDDISSTNRFWFF